MESLKIASAAILGLWKKGRGGIGPFPSGTGGWGRRRRTPLIGRRPYRWAGNESNIISKSGSTRATAKLDRRSAFFRIFARPPSEGAGVARPDDGVGAAHVARPETLFLADRFASSLQFLKNSISQFKRSLS